MEIGIFEDLKLVDVCHPRYEKLYIIYLRHCVLTFRSPMAKWSDVITLM